ncbi:hypothetical protein [Pseudoroseomonas cervicalis]|uniref:hypothetical protein n=1 Tax=Teichococcus cervicalis TaxID=204525 RepID=UPI002781DE5E|nr:hypothetical protein [Pseudoroseomonas cervicalis]MDQ1079695.1 hypothetical protein [Pseudoroseomonas cervicalis]
MRLADFSPRWLELARGVRVLYAPPGEAEWAAAVIMARRHLAEIEAKTGEMSEVERGALLDRLIAKGAARLAISGWEGVEDEFSPAGAEILMSMPGMFELFIRQVMADLDAVKSEGNASAPAPNGTSEAGENTATDVASPE